MPWTTSSPGTGTNCITFDSFLYPRQVLVVVPLRKQPTLFGGIFGYTGVSIGALAQAQLDPGGARVCTFCVLGDGPHDLQNGNLSVSGGNLWFNGDVEIGPNGSATSIKSNVTGDDGNTFEDGGNAYVSGAINGSSTKFQGGTGQAGQPRVVDPLAAEVLPFQLQSTLTAKTDPCTQGPGIYGGLRSTGGTCTLQPGLYVFTGDVTLSGGAGLVANGATMYFTCGTPTAVRACEQSR